MAELEQTMMTLIIHSGNARACAYEAFELAMTGDFAGAAAKMKEAAAELGQTHAQQTALIQDEAQGNGVAPSLLMVHAQPGHPPLPRSRRCHQRQQGRCADGQRAEQRSLVLHPLVPSLRGAGDPG